jgi:hypothetical protein
VRKFLSIIFVVTYVASAVQPHLTLIDFYLKRDFYTQNYCINLDAGITQCRASCYLQSLLEEEQNDNDAEIVVLKKLKSAENLTQNEDRDFKSDSIPIVHNTNYDHNYRLDLATSIFHPPKLS